MPQLCQKYQIRQQDTRPAPPSEQVDGKPTGGDIQHIGQRQTARKGRASPSSTRNAAAMAGRYHTAASSAAATANSSSQSCIVSGFRLYQRFMGFSLLPCQRAIPAVDRAKVVHLPPRLGQQLRRYGAALPAAAADNDRVAVGRQVRQLLFQPVQRNIARTGICPAAYSAGVRTSHKMARCCISCRACAGVMRFWFLIQFAPFVQIQSKLYAPGKKFMI